MTRCATLGPQFVGDPVDVTTGEVRDVATDFRLFGARGLAFVRVYRSLRAEDRGFGRGHRHMFDWTLRRDVDGLRVDTPQDSIRFAPGSEGPTRGWTLTRISDHAYRLACGDAEPIRELVRDKAGGREYRLQRMLHADGGETELAYRGARGVELASVRDSEGWHLAFGWSDGLLRSISVTGPFGTFTPMQYVYDEARRLLLEGRDAYGHAFAWSYDADGRVVRRTDRRGYAFVFDYDARGRCVRVGGEDGVGTIAIEYAASGRETKVVHADNGAASSYHYAADRRLVEIRDPYGACRQFFHADDGTKTHEIDGAGHPIRARSSSRSIADTALAQEHDASAGRFDVPSTDALARAVPGDVAAALVPAEFTGIVRPVRDAQGRLLRDDRTFPGSDYTQSRRYVYDGNGNVCERHDLDGAAWSFTYASWDQRVLVVDPLGGRTQISWTARDRVASVSDAGGSQTDYRSDLCDRLTEVHRHGKLRERYAYDGAGALVAKQGQHDRTLVEYRRGSAGALLSRTTWDGTKETFERDDAGRIVVATSGDTLTAARTIRRAYDDRGRVTSETRDGVGFTHAYDDTQRTRTTFRTRGSAAIAIEFRRAADGSTAIVDPTGCVHAIRSLGSGLWEREFASGTNEVAQYDGTGRCLAKVSRGASGIWRRRFVRTGEGDLSYREDDRRGRTDFRYDAAHRLVEVRHADERVDAYEHDPAGNLLHKPGLREFAPIMEGPPDLRDARRLSMSDGNRIRRANSDRFHYDEQNHISGRAGEWGEHVFVHDALGRLKKVYYQNVRGAIKLRWESDYDALGRRTHRRRYRKGGALEAWEFFWDGDRLGAETLPDGRLRIYVYATASTLVPLLAIEYASVGSDPASARVFVLQSDHRGAIERVEDSAGAIVWEATVHPYGEAEVDDGEDFHQPFRLVGQYTDPGVNLSYHRFRYWSPELGRFLESDPRGLAGGTNVYAWPGCPLVTSLPLGVATTAEEGVDLESPIG